MSLVQIWVVSSVLYVRYDQINSIHSQAVLEMALDALSLRAGAAFTFWELVKLGTARCIHKAIITQEQKVTPDESSSSHHFVTLVRLVTFVRLVIHPSLSTHRLLARQIAHHTTSLSSSSEPQNDTLSRLLVSSLI